MTHRSAAPVVLALIVGMMGLLNTVSSLLAPVVHPMRGAWILRPLPSGSRLLSVVTGFLLLLLAPQVARAKRLAWQLTVGTLQLSVVLHLVKGLNWPEALVQMGVLEALIWFRPAFRARSDPPSVARGLLTLVAGIVFGYGYTVLGLYFLDAGLHRHFSLSAALREAVLLLSPFTPMRLQAFSPRARWFLDSVYLVFGSTALYGFLMLFRPFVYRRTTWRQERERAQAIAMRWARSALVYFTLQDDKLFWFSPSGRSYVSYRLVGDVALVLGDPVGPPDDVPAAIAAFTEEAARNGWVPAFLQVLPDHLEAYRQTGYQVLKLGEEALVDLAGFDLVGRQWRDIRQARNRLQRRGYQVRTCEPPIPDDLLERLRQVSDAWLRRKAGPERTFSLGRFDSRALKETPVVYVEGPGGEIVAFANLQPMYGLDQVSPDLMRYHPGAPNGTMEFLLSEIALRAREQGVATLNLGMAPFANVGGEGETDLPHRTVRFLYLRFNRFYNFQGLRAFKEKFNPRWEPRYLVYPSATVLPRVALAAVRAGSTQGLAGFLRQAGSSGSR
ncbi:phosphatidylglycerol lysyltransferase domain-containing protein [Caldinitratiruptor microaerophilus]|uniref:Phosphatidylglycerol lysyltransferase C-terminal domain-containing protein n=1 Tax=Caldinitratiruptor microaerophilus TaxID=671077 RepID=A0AA35G8D0_9FIRM|nr:phosphatidylglycerol lysyltransferase domain-containing protein [Caldinitratiruptor microaerophilus]BDG60303.1 hypothetical protein caldi_13930 [Caldinitratiruptor microaerophilus]